MIYRVDGNLENAISELELVVDLDHQVSNPDLTSATLMLEQLRQEQAQAG